MFCHYNWDTSYNFQFDINPRIPPFLLYVRFYFYTEKFPWWRVTCLPRCNGLDVIPSGGVSTGTCFHSVTKPDLHSAMLIVKLSNKSCWDCYGLERDRFGMGSFVVWDGKMGDQKSYFVVMQDISMHYIDDVLHPHAMTMQDPITSWL